MHTLWQTIKRNNLKYTRLVVTFLAAALVVSVSNILITRSTGAISDSAAANNSEAVVSMLLVLTGLTVIKAICSGVNVFITHRGRGYIESELRQNFADYLLSIPFKELSGESSGNLLSIFSNDLPQTAAVLTTDLFAFLSELLLLIVSAFFMFSILPKVTLAFLVMIPPLAYLQMKISEPIATMGIEASKRQGAYNAVISDSLQNTTTIVAYGLEDIMEQRYKSSYQPYFETMKTFVDKNVTLIISGVLATNLPIIFAYIVVALAVIQGEMSIGGFVAYTAIATSAGDWLSMLSQRLRSIRTRQASAVRLLDNTAALPEWEVFGKAIKLRDTKAEAGQNEPESIALQLQSEEEENLLTSGDKKQGGTDQGADFAIAFENVSFSYDGENPVLRDINLTISPAEKVGIVGSGSSGKSTLLKLMQTLYFADSGTVSFGSDLLSKLNLPTVRKLLAYVPQDSYLFPRSIRENLLGPLSGNPKTEDEEELLHLIRYCLKQAEILEFVDSLPDGIDTILDEAAENVSGGQRQRLAIARALCQQAPILLLDEATSALDAKSEECILRTLLDPASVQTVIFVSHRPAVLQACQRLLVLDEGRIVEEGTFAELLCSQGVFAKLYESGQIRRSNNS